MSIISDGPDIDFEALAKTKLVVINNGADDKTDVHASVFYTDGAHDVIRIGTVARGASISVPVDPAKTGMSTVTFICRYDGVMRTLGKLEDRAIRTATCWWVWSNGLEELFLLKS